MKPTAEDLKHLITQGDPNKLASLRQIAYWVNHPDEWAAYRDNVDRLVSELGPGKRGGP